MLATTPGARLQPIEQLVDVFGRAASAQVLHPTLCGGALRLDYRVITLPRAHL